MDATLARTLQAGAHALSVPLDERVIEGLGRYLDILLLWNRRVSLSAVRNPEGILEKHFLDSLAVLPHVPADTRTLIDVGSGAGFPGAVLALARPGLHVTLVEAIHKKTAFLEALRRELALTNLTVLTRRIEACVVSADVAVSRATWDLSEWLERGALLVRPGGIVLGMEGAEEHTLPPRAERYAYPLGKAKRAIVVFHVER